MFYSQCFCWYFHMLIISILAMKNKTGGCGTQGQNNSNS